MKNNRIKYYTRFDWKNKEKQDNIMLVDSAEENDFKVCDKLVNKGAFTLKLNFPIIIFSFCFVFTLIALVSIIESNVTKVKPVETVEKVEIANEPTIVPDRNESPYVNVDVIANERAKNPEKFEIGYCYASQLYPDSPFRNKNEMEFHSIICIENIKDEYVQYRFIFTDFDKEYMMNKAVMNSDRIYRLDYFNTRIGKMEDILRYK